MLLSGTFKLGKAEHFANLGFEVIDIDFCSTVLEGEKHDPLLDGEDWIARIDAEKAKLDVLGLAVNSCHLPFKLDYTRLDLEENAKKHELVCRSLIAAERMGAKWAIMHVDKKSADMEEAIVNTVVYVKRLYADTGVKEITVTIENSSHRELAVPIRSYDILKEQGYRAMSLS